MKGDWLGFQSKVSQPPHATTTELKNTLDKQSTSTKLNLNTKNDFYNMLRKRNGGVQSKEKGIIGNYPKLKQNTAQSSRTTTIAPHIEAKNARPFELPISKICLF